MWIFYLGTLVCGGGLGASLYFHFFSPERMISTDLILVIGFLGVMFTVVAVGDVIRITIENHSR